jgi:hemerythrin
MDLLTRHDMGETVGVEALNLLKSWLTNHIVKVDKQYVEHFRAAGIAV